MRLFTSLPSIPTFSFLPAPLPIFPSINKCKYHRLSLDEIRQAPLNRDYIDRILNKKWTDEDIHSPPVLSKRDMVVLLGEKDKKQDENLFAYAGQIALKEIGNKVYYRGLIELSNVCQKSCYYCGIRKESKVQRYTMPDEEIIETAMWAHKQKFGSICLQSGELLTDKRMDHLVYVISEIKKRSSADGSKGLGMTLCLGENTKENYQRLFDAGGHRYLLRIESSNPDLYKKLHPHDENHSWESRKKCLEHLKEIGFQVGTGVMIGLPFQTLEDLAEDVLFFKHMGVHMIGMGPYILEPTTPLGIEFLKQKEMQKVDPYSDAFKESCLYQGVRMIAVTRIFLRKVNIAATTALQALSHSKGRELGMTAGANILMPIITPTKYRENYQLYAGKPCIDDTPSQCQVCLMGRVWSVGKEVGIQEWGDSLQYYQDSLSKHPLNGEDELDINLDEQSQLDMNKIPSNFTNPKNSGIISKRIPMGCTK